MKPDFLLAGDHVAIIAPSGRVFKEELQENLAFLKSMELEPVLGNHLFEDYDNGYHYAGKIEDRLYDFQWAIDDEDIKAIWCARGGYGAVQLIDRLDWDRFIQNPKWLIGYSDITVFHNHLNNWEIPTIHGLTIKKLNTEYHPETFSTLQKALFGEKLKYEIPSHALNQIGNARGKLVGGNLSIIYSLMGSLSTIQGENLILFIEDWNENWYHLDRMMMNLKRSGLLKKIKGLIVGSFTKMDLENENPDFHTDYDPMSFQIIHQFMENYTIPICFGFPAGHIGDNRALILGTEVEFNISNEIVKLEFY
ncbi:S66 peptidase family protein [Moheibacter lacus]|uniref:LD-carboxypeptidase n=1 Tax=Moheibacter lacus TaxID=2745851 RepID=A0A838ZN09_9FLAO|nr:LD-carboxypeptidase [Moheibacter lacus]MBA5628527.1 LD-carboxypeptidase [Moheibacter lacus]